MNYPPFNFQTRAETLKKLKQDPPVFDAVIIGGGIVGGGLSRELSIRGLSSLLVEKNDFASGTSSRSSKLIHGGLRYLEMGDFYLVFEALSERHWLIKSHPHLVQPVEFNVPIYDMKDAPKGARSTALIGIGLWLYDFLSAFRAPFMHGKHSRKETLTLFPRMQQKGLKGSYFYPDAMMLDDELVMETLLDAQRRGAECLNYVEATHVSKKGADGLYEVTLKETRDAEEKFVVKAREVITCVGPWTERIGSSIEGGAVKKLKPSRGTHFILPWKRFPIDQCLVMYAPDGRVSFCIPRKDLGTDAEIVIIGTTDSPENDSPDKVRAHAEDVDYLLELLKNYFPDANIGRDDILMTYAGVRPLIDSGAESEAKTSREHEIWRNPEGVVFMAGGKYTTFRRISQEIAAFAFPKSRGKNASSKETLSAPSDYTERLKGNPIWGKYTDRWFQWKMQHHCPLNLEDIVFRRVPLWMGGREVTEALLEKVASLAQPYFGWSDEMKKKEVLGVTKKLKEGYEWL